MQKVDRFLLAIVAGVIGLVLVAFVILLTRPKPTYLPDDTPGAVVHNYLLALQFGDDSRAYGYISPTARGYPRTLDAFRRSIQQNSYSFDGLKTATLAVGESTVSGDTASVPVTQRNVDSGNILGSSDYSTIRLQRTSQTGAWQIVGADRYWAYCWDNSGGC